jgi:hypothetical protein
MIENWQAVKFEAVVNAFSTDEGCHRHPECWRGFVAKNEMSTGRPTMSPYRSDAIVSASRAMSAYILGTFFEIFLSVSEL